MPLMRQRPATAVAAFWHRASLSAARTWARTAPADEGRLADRGDRADGNGDVGAKPNADLAAASSSADARSGAIESFTATATAATPELAALHGAGHTGAVPAHATTDLTGAATAGTSAPFDAQLSAALGSREFAPALGLQLSILAKEGVQEARLHLNPADMGPIAVQIAVDGQHARVHFQADLAATRDALQASMPDLANAMRDAGLMLAGGDVSGGGGSDGRAQQDGAAASRTAGNGGDAESSARAAAGASRVTRPRGVVDVFA